MQSEYIPYYMSKRVYSILYVETSISDLSQIRTNVNDSAFVSTIHTLCDKTQNDPEQNKPNLNHNPKLAGLG